MWVNKIRAMSIGALWVARTQNEETCPDCGQVWVHAAPGGSDVLVLLEQPVLALTEQTLLANCLKAAGWHDTASCMSLHASCSSYPEQVLRVIREQVDQLQPGKIVVFGARTVSLIDAQLQTGEVQNWQDRPLIVTHSLREMLDDPRLKARVWRDLCVLAHAV